MKKPIIAIDGPAASGKGTLSRKIAAELGFAHMDTGALYRAVAFEVLAAGGNSENETDALRGAEALKSKIPAALGNPALREDEIGNAASKVAAIPALRSALLTLQRDFTANPPSPYKGAVLDGRDIGSIVCPDAAVKLFVTARDEVRAQRRTKELQSRGLSVTYEAVLKDMRERDARDAGRTVAPMVKAPDAFLIDTSDLDETQVLETALDIIRKNIPA